jgi:penicillin-binding protein 1A
VLGRRDLSGKTGTSNDQRDAWFGGFNSDLASIVWVGYDDDLPLGPGEEGSRTALPIWIEFMRIALEGVSENQMKMPDGIISVLIDRDTGCPARAGQRNTIFEYFFNDAAGMDPDPEAEAEEEEPLF